ncbi:MAG: DUF2934 domain-containing protein [Candidatus Zixiibacteriota bacterium]|mgnify:FL=1
MTIEVKRTKWVTFLKQFNATNQYRKATVSVKRPGSKNTPVDRDVPFMGVAIARKGRVIEGIELFMAQADPERLNQPTVSIKQPAKIVVEKGADESYHQLVVEAKDGTVAKIDLSGTPQPEHHRSVIERLAYSIYERRGHTPGRDVEDWLEAEQKIRQVEHSLVE